MTSSHLALAVVLLTSLSPSASSAARKRASAKEALSAALNSHRDAIQGCMTASGSAALAPLHMEVHLTVSGHGQLIHSRVAVAAPKAPEAGISAIKSCVEAILKTIKWPRNDAPLITIDRTWDMQEG